jgi:hypothetical protein
VLGEYLVTGIKDEGAVSSFASRQLVESIGYKDYIRALDSREVGSFHGVGGESVPVLGKITNVPLQVGEIDYVI